MSILDLKTGAPEPWHELQVAAYVHGEPCDLDFDPEHHVYKLEGRIIPSVTQILDDMGEISEFAKQSERARERGVMVHIAGSLLPDRLDWSTVSSEIFGYVLSCSMWFGQTEFTPEAQEQRVYIKDLNVAGTLDLRGAFQGGHQPSGSLYLQQNGSMAKFKPCEPRKAWTVFVSIVNHWKWRKENGRNH